MIAFGGGRRTLAPHVLSSSDLELSPKKSFIYSCRALFLPPGLHHCFQEMAYPPSQLVLLGIRGAKRASHAQGRVTLERSKNSLFQFGSIDMEVPDVVQSAGGYRGSTAPQRL